MSDEMAEWAIQNLYENPALRDELTDSEAEILLRWGEDQVMRLSQLAVDDASFEAAFDRLSSLIRRMNRLAGRRADFSPEEIDAALNRIAEYAVQIGLSIQPERLMSFAQDSASPDNLENVRAVIDLVTGDSPPPPQEGTYVE